MPREDKNMSDKFPKDCWGKDCVHFHIWDMSIDDYTCICDLLKVQVDDCDRYFDCYPCPKQYNSTTIVPPEGVI